MDFHDKDFFDRLMKLTEENNKLLHKLWRHAQIGRAVKILYWVALIGISIGALYYIQPFIDQFAEVYTGAKDSIGTFQSLMSLFDQPPPQQ
jgi:hypothetical protein